jgi:hypothetical protein
VGAGAACSSAPSPGAERLAEVEVRGATEHPSSAGNPIPMPCESGRARRRGHGIRPRQPHARRHTGRAYGHAWSTFTLVQGTGILVHTYLPVPNIHIPNTGTELG